MSCQLHSSSASPTSRNGPGRLPPMLANSTSTRSIAAKRFGDRGRVGEIARGDLGVAAGVEDLGLQTFELVQAASDGEHTRTGAREPERALATDARARSGDEHDATVKPLARARHEGAGSPSIVEQRGEPPYARSRQRRSAAACSGLKDRKPPPAFIPSRPSRTSESRESGAPWSAPSPTSSAENAPA